MLVDVGIGRHPDGVNNPVDDALAPGLQALLCRYQLPEFRECMR